MASVVCGAATAASAGLLSSPAVLPGSGIELSLRTPFEDAPSAGACTVEVTLRNGSRRDGTWELSLGARAGYGWTHTMRQKVAVEAGASRTFLVVGLMQRPFAGVQLAVRGPGIDPRPVTACEAHGNYWTGSAKQQTLSRPVAVSRSLVSTGGGVAAATANQEIQGRRLVLSSFAPEELPADARSYSGFAFVLMRQEEWSGLRADVREAIEDWVALGGNLWLLGSAASEVPRGFGLVSSSPLVGQTDLDWVPLVEQAFAGTSWELGWEAYQPWSLPGRLPAEEIPRNTLAFLVVVASILIGPLNLYWFARGRLRHRVYWTTPLIAAATALVLLALIMSRDGTGGAGHRWTAIAIVPEAHRAAVVQEQFARTGLLLDGRFRAADALRVRPISPETDWRNLRGTPQELEAVGDTHSGWFRSRSLQGQYLETVRPTRARVQVRRTGGLEAVSSIESALQDLFVVDAQGDVWHGSNIAAGVPAPLERSQAFDSWFASALQNAGPAGRGHLQPLARRRRYFYAAANAPGGAIETLGSIRWTQDRLLYVGPIEEVR
jgi:hypothetical protein